MRWRLTKDERPPEGLFWGYVLGRYERPNIRDAEIRIFENVSGEIRTLDYAGVYFLPDSPGNWGAFEIIVAWMPLNEMITPDHILINEPRD